MSKRDISYDLLKIIGMIGIFLAHTINTPPLINYLRNYEVFLLVITSGVFLGKKEIKSINEYFIYLRKRIPKLVLPTWLFLSVLFSGIFIISKITHTPFPYSQGTVIESYTMTNGIGYVWIMLVYSLIAIGSPLVNILLRKIDVKFHYLMILILWAAYEVIYYFVSPVFDMNIGGYLIKNVLMYLLAYSIIASLGMVVECKRTSRKITVAFSLLLLVVHFLLYVIPSIQAHSFLDMGKYKYPPSLIYASYGVGVSLLLIVSVKWIVSKIGCQKDMPFISFIGKRINWIYFNHIFMIYVWNMVIHVDNWILMFCFLLSGSILLTAIFDYILNALLKYSKNDFAIQLVHLFWGQI